MFLLYDSDTEAYASEHLPKPEGLSSHSQETRIRYDWTKSKEALVVALMAQSVLANSTVFFLYYHSSHENWLRHFPLSIAMSLVLAFCFSMVATCSRCVLVLSEVDPDDSECQKWLDWMTILTHVLLWPWALFATLAMPYTKEYFGW